MKRIFLLCIPLLFGVMNAFAEAHIEYWIDEDGCKRFDVIYEDNPGEVIVIPATPEEQRELRDFEIEVKGDGDGDFTIIDSRHDRRWECDHFSGSTTYQCRRDPLH